MSFSAIAFPCCVKKPVHHEGTKDTKKSEQTFYPQITQITQIRITGVCADYLAETCALEPLMLNRARPNPDRQNFPRAIPKLINPSA
jgi:hypothetical protein